MPNRIDKIAAVVFAAIIIPGLALLWVVDGPVSVVATLVGAAIGTLLANLVLQPDAVGAVANALREWATQQI